MTKIQKFLVAALLVIGGSAVAIQQLDLDVSTKLQALTKGLIIGPATIRSTDARINANRITRALGATGTINFALLAAGGCEESSAITVVGARTGDACHVGAPVLTGADAGVLQGNFTCFVSASDAVKVRFCASAATGDDPASADFRVRVISAQ